MGLGYWMVDQGENWGLKEAYTMKKTVKRQKSVSSRAKDLVLDTLERNEDMALSALADERIAEAEKKKQNTISHQDAWK